MQRYFGRVFEKQAILEEDDVFHLTRVMRAKPKDRIEVVSDGIVYLCEIRAFKPLEIAVIKKLNENNELDAKVILIASLIKGDKMDFVLQKATELGVGEIVLLQTERTVVRLRNDDRDVKMIRFNRILKEAAEQSKRTQIPILHRVVDLHHLRKIDADIKMIAYEGMEGSTEAFNKIVHSIKKGQKVAILIGPEGGFSEEEVEIAKKAGYKKVGLGRRILRAETASLYALSVIADFLERK